MIRRFTCAAAITVLAFSVAPASAEMMDASTVTCQKLLDIASVNGATGAEKESQTKLGVMMMWMQGYKAPNDHGTAVDTKTVMSNIDHVVESCTKTPNLGVMTVTEKLWDDDDALPSTAVDLSTVTCESMMKADDETRGIMLVWLLGYNNAVEEDPTFDLDALGEKVAAIAKYCVENPAMGLVTASKKADQ